MRMQPRTAATVCAAEQCARSTRSAARPPGISVAHRLHLSRQVAAARVAHAAVILTRGVNQVASSFTRASAARIRSAAKRCASAIRTAAMSLGMRRALRLPMTCAHRSPAALTRLLRCQSTAVATSHIQRPLVATSPAAAAKCAPMQILFTAAKWGGMPPVRYGLLKSATNAAIRSPEVATHNTPHQTARTEPAARQCA